MDLILLQVNDVAFVFFFFFLFLQIEATLC